MGMYKTLCYANLNSFNSAEGITDEQMQKFFERQFNDMSGKVVDVIIDRYNDDVSLEKREGWAKVIQACRDERTDLIVVPSITMLTVAPGEVISIVEDMKHDFRIDFYFIRENISTSKEEYRMGLQFHLVILQEYMQIRKKEEALRELFKEVTGMASEPSAVPVLVDKEQYDKAHQLAHCYGMSVRELVSALLTFSTIPQNKVAFEEHILGIEPPKEVSKRGRPRNQE